MKLTETAASQLALPAGATDKVFFDDKMPGFGLRVRAGGSRKWVVHYRQGGIQRRHTIGKAEALTLEEARKRARKILAAVDDGRDPAVEKAAKRAATALVFSSVMDDYLAARKRVMKPRSYEECDRHLRKHWKPLHNLAVGSITRATVAVHLRKIAEASGPVAADRARSTLSAMYAWAIGEGLCEANPVLGTNKASDAKPRERVLSDAELAAIWKAAPASDYGRIVRLLMLTGQRRDEIGSLCWSEVDRDAKLITLGSERTKNSRPHDVPLSDSALSVLDECGQVEGRDLVFGEGEGGYSGWSRSKAALDETLKLETPWTLHDLRRTAATRLGDLGVQPHVVEAILNHVSGHKAGVAGIYNKSVYAAEKRAALDVWASHIKVVVAKAEGGNVVKLEKSRA